MTKTSWFCTKCGQQLPGGAETESVGIAAFPSTSEIFHMERTRRRHELARDILLKLIEGQGDDRRVGTDTDEGSSMSAPNMAREAVSTADALLAELAKPKEAP